MTLGERVVYAVKHILNLDIVGKHDAKPTYEELKNWLDSGQVNVLRMSTPQ